MTFGELRKKYKGYEVNLTGWPLEKRWIWLGVPDPKDGDWDSVEIIEYEVKDDGGWSYSLTTGKAKTFKGHVLARVKRRSENA